MIAFAHSSGIRLIDPTGNPISDISFNGLEEGGRLIFRSIYWSSDDRYICAVDGTQLVVFDVASKTVRSRYTCDSISVAWYSPTDLIAAIYDNSGPTRSIALLNASTGVLLR